MNAPRVLCLHGASGNAATWGPVLDAWDPALAARAVDLPGRGATPKPPLADVAALADAVLADLPPGPAPLLVGHSLGGAVALMAALRHPSRVTRIALVSSASRLRVAPTILQAAAQATPTTPLRLDFAFGPHTPPSVIARYHADAATTPPAASVADWQACDGFDVRARLGEVRARVLVAYGAADVLTPAKHQGPLTDALPRAQRAEHPTAGHMLPWEAPAWLGQILVDFLQS
ncbi:MAG: alpha/beta fold hydrolase [Myxococcales bacterium]|nr:alpha/beta fold hydrolase [Myxococcales bacterium]